MLCSPGTNAFSCCNIPKGVSSADDERSDSNFNDVFEELDSILRDVILLILDEMLPSKKHTYIHIRVFGGEFVNGTAS